MKLVTFAQKVTAFWKELHGETKCKIISITSGEQLITIIYTIKKDDLIMSAIYCKVTDHFFNSQIICKIKTEDNSEVTV